MEGRSRLRLGLLLLACLGLTFRVAAADNFYCHVIPFYGYFGGDIGGGVALQNIYQCADRCFNNADCLAFSWGSNKQCWIKSGLGSPQPSPDFVSVLTGYNDCRGNFWSHQP